MWTFRTAPAEEAVIVVRNVLVSPREREPVVISWKRLTELTGAAIPDELTITDPSGSEVVFQTHDLDADGVPDEAVFMTGLGPFEEKRFSVARGAPHPPRPAASATDARNYKNLNGRSVSVDDDRQPGSARDRKAYRFDGAGWESNLSAYRLYLDGRNAVDVQGKRKPGLYWKWIGESGVLSTSGLQSRAGDSLMLAVAVPADRVIRKQVGESDELLVLDARPGETVPIMIGACWQGGGEGEWNEMTSGRMLAMLADRVQSPPVVELRRGAGGSDLKGERR